MLSVTRTLAGLLLLPTLAVVPAVAANVTAPFTESLVAGSLSSPTAMQFAPDGRLFVCEQGGTLRVIKDGALLTTPFVSLSVASDGERGLLGVAFDPAFAVNQFVYVYYTTTTPAVHNRISRFTAKGDVAVAGSEVVILELDNLNAAYHNGGALAFGPDGKLYVGVGENQVGANAQSLSTLLGKMLRINADGSIPTDNPFLNATTGKNRAIWAMGLRNPFTFAFSRSGQMFINDVGESTWEEINDGVAGANYGWPTTEGPTTAPGFWSPRYSYIHDGTICAIVGGSFYTPLTGQFPSDYANTYFFGDYCAGWIKRLDPANGNAITTFATGIASLVDLKVGDDGSLYYLARGAASGSVYRISYGAKGPSITTQPVSQTVAPGTAVTLSVRASGPAPLRYQWQLNNVNIAGATAADYKTAPVIPADDGAKYRALVSNDFDSVFSDTAVLKVLANSAPTVKILAPVAGALYSGGSVIQYSGSGTDTEDGQLPASAFTWQVDFHHDTHLHPFIPATTGVTGGTFTIPTIGETSANVWYRVLLTVTDSGGLTASAQVDVLPRKATLTLATSPAGLQLQLDGQPTASPLSFDSVAGIVRNLAAPSPQVVNGTTYEFVSWSDGGAATHDVSGPVTNTTYTATYRVSGGTVPVGGTGTGLLATYFNNMDFTGTSITRVDPAVDFVWGLGSPDPAIDADTFSARWTGQVEAPLTDTYTFYTQSDDGVRLWVNGQLLINNWTDHGTVEDSGTIALVAGQRYDITMEFYENAVLATARLLWSSSAITKTVVTSTRLYPAAPPPPTGGVGTGIGLSGAYFNSINLTGSSISRLDPTVDFSWGLGPPAPGINYDQFSVRWTGQVEAPLTGTYTFYTVSDDGVRLWVNGQQLVNDWADHGTTEDRATIALVAGQRYDIVMEFYDNAYQATAQLLWASSAITKAVIPSTRLYPSTVSVPDSPIPPTLPAGGTGTGLAAAYFNGIDLAGTSLTRLDPTVDFMWNSSAPAPIQSDSFSARWTGQVEAPVTGAYTFYTQSDDGVRLWVNGQKLVDDWSHHATTEDSGTVTLITGQKYNIVMEYFQDGGDATARLLWAASSITKAVIPSTRLYPSTTITALLQSAIKINLQPSPSTVYAGYVPDSGPVHAHRGNALSYGGNVKTTAYAYDRNSSRSANRRYDTLIYKVHVVGNTQSV